MVSLADPRVSNPVLSSLNIRNEDKIIFIRENSLADSNFIITHLFKQLLYEKSRICFVILHNTFQHYQLVGKKLGYDLKQVIERGEMKVIDPFKEVVENIGLELEDITANKRTQILKCVFNLIKKEVDAFLSTKDHPVYIIIDDLSHFLDLGVELSALINFTNLCINLTSDKNIFTAINYHVGSKNDLIVANSIQYICDVFVCVSPLKTGRSVDVTGVMTIQRGQNHNKYHFKAFDRGVKTFHPGEVIYNLDKNWYQ